MEGSLSGSPTIPILGTPRLVFHTLPLECSQELLTHFSRTEYGKSDRMSVLSLVYKKTGLLLGLLSLPPSPPPPFPLLFPGKPAACCGLCYGEAHVARNEYCLLTAMEDLWMLTAP